MRIDNPERDIRLVTNQTCNTGYQAVIVLDGPEHIVTGKFVLLVLLGAVSAFALYICAGHRPCKQNRAQVGVQGQE